MAFVCVLVDLIKDLYIWPNSPGQHCLPRRGAGCCSFTIGLSYDFGARNYLPALPRWNSMDPLAEKYYSISPYVYCAGNPVNLVDLDGEKIRIFYKENGQTLSFLYSGSETEIPDNEYVQAVVEAYKYNKENWKEAGLASSSPVTELVENEDLIIGVYQSINFDSKSFRDNGGVQYIIWNQWEGTVTDNGKVLSPATILSHEADHAIDDYRNAKKHSDRQEQLMKDYTNQEEYRVITGSEQLTAIANGEILPNEVTRYNHKGKTVYTTGPTSSIIDKVATMYFYNHYYKKRKVW